MRGNIVAEPGLTGMFYAASGNKPDSKPKNFTFRITDEERAMLEQRARNQTLSAYIRDRLLNESVKERRVLRKPKIDDQKLSFVLSLLGEQRIASNLNQLAKHANMGTLDCEDETVERIQEACAAMIAIRDFLLDIKEES